MGFLEIFLSMLAWEAGSAVLSPALEFISGSKRLDDLQVDAQRIQARNQEIAQRRLVTDEQVGLMNQKTAAAQALPHNIRALQSMDPANYEAVAAPFMPKSPTTPQAPAPVAPGVRIGGPSAPPADPKLQAAMVGGVVNPVLLDQLEASLG